MTQTLDEHPLMKPGRGRLQEKVAIVTGADSGIGRAKARLFAREGASVVCLDVYESGKPRIDELIKQDGGSAAFVLGDVTRPDDWKQAVDTAFNQFGGLHVLHQNAGGGAGGRIHEMEEEAWQRIIDLNMGGLFHGCRAVLPHFMAQGEGNIVFTASTHGLFGRPGNTVYTATKAAIVNLTRTLALDYGPAVRVNCVCPGPIATPSWRGWPPQPRRERPGADVERASHVKALHREGRPEEVAYAVLFLACDESSYITGHPLVIDGGQTIDVH